MLVWKVFRAAEWAAFEAAGETAGAPVDLADGFIHFSTAAQLPATLRRHFAGERDLVLAGVAVAQLGDALRWEPARGGDLFPHLYRPLRRAEVARIHHLPEPGADDPLPPGD
ncbi:MAG: hypothetical protein KatS3mg118_3052 [Paracoccaceae bacterium]|nr:MAG: DUF952 domain-containing protein [Alphaproteobacteria bacterium]GIX15093.1 MAG: hypothetical protein KatS3mg118_3052 [Paracoccaceae bacterium]